MVSDYAILDSSFLISLCLEKDSVHEKALELSRKFNLHTMVVHPFVIQEVATVLTYKGNKKIAHAFLRSLHVDPKVFIPVLEVQEDGHFFIELDKKISFTDATVIRLAKKLSGELVTFDDKMIRVYRKLK